MDRFVDAADKQPIGANDRRRPRIRTGAAFVVSLAALALAGCAASAPTYAVLERDAQPIDELPEALSPDAGDHADLATARFIAEHEGTSLWLTRGDDPSAICLLAYEDASTWLIGCGGQDGPVGIGGALGRFTVVPDGALGPASATQISENVYTTNAD